MNIQRMQEQADQAARLMQACSHPARLMLLCQLSQAELNVTQLESLLNLRQPSLSQHLGVLRRRGLIQARRAGQQVFYRLASSQAQAIIQCIYQTFCTASPSSSLVVS